MIYRGVGTLCSEFPKELSIKIDNEHSLKLTRGYKLSSGRNNLRFIKWYTYKIENKEDFGLEYDNIAFSFTRITKDILISAAENIVKDGVSTAPLPNIDASTGNIHPAEKDTDTDPNGKFCQLVLCMGSGPNTPYFTEIDDYYCYTGVHKACYYPLIDKNDEEGFKCDIRQIILKAVWNKLHEK